ncbi:MAG: alpha/beta hydrolase family protein [Tepidisphaeraceae bacterium]
MSAAPPGQFQFDPLLMLDGAAASRRLLAFTAKTSREARAWQKSARTALARCLGFLDTPKVAPRPREIEKIDRGAYVRHKIVLRTSARSELPLYLLVPKHGRGKRPVVLALHGHGYGVKDIVGLWEDGLERLAPDGYHRDFGCQLAERGFVVAAPEISCFGERQIGDVARFRASGLSASCHNVATYAMMLGGSAAGIRVMEAMRVVDYLQRLAFVDRDRIGVMGISGGGMHALFSAAIDQRIKAAVISGYFCDWRHSILSIFHCTCNFVPGLLRLGELSDLAGLIAPRPLLVEHGTRDEIFPIEHVKRTVRKARRAWGLLGAAGAVETDYFEGRHCINGPAAYDFLARHLDLESSR